MIQINIFPPLFHANAHDKATWIINAHLRGYQDARGRAYDALANARQYIANAKPMTAVLILPTAENMHSQTVLAQCDHGVSMFNDCAACNAIARGERFAYSRPVLPLAPC